MTLAERIAARLSGISTDRYMFGLFGEGRMGEGGFGKLQILGKTKHVTRCQNCGRAGLKHAVVCAVVGEDGHPTNQYYYFGTDCAAKLAGKAEKDVEAEAEHQESSGRPRMKNLKPAKPNEGQMELSLRFAAAWQAHVERYGRVKPTKGQSAFDFDALSSAPQAEPAAGKPAAVEPPALPSKGRQMGLFDQPQAAAPAAKPASDWDEKKHPRWDAGDKQHHGGQFSPKTEQKQWKHGEKESAEEVLERVKASPNQPQDRDWGRYAGGFGIEGGFHHVQLPVTQLMQEMQAGNLRKANNTSHETIQRKIDSGERNPVIITKEPGRGGLVVDGNHSLQAAIAAGDKTVKAIVSEKSVFAPKQAENPAIETPKPTEKAKLTPPEFRDWRFVSSTRNSGTIYPNRPGQSFTPEQIAHLQKWARQNGMTTHQSGPYKIEVVGNDHKERLDLDFMGAFGVKREKQDEAASQAKAKDAARKQQAADSFSGRPSADFINSAFGDSMNTANKTYLADFLEGKERKFNGIWGRNHVEGLQKLNAINAQGQVDFKALQSAYQSHGSEKPTEPQFDFAAIVKEARAKGQNIHAAAREAGVPVTHENKRALMKAVNDLPPEEPKIGPGQARGQAKFNEARAKEEQPAPSGFEPYQHDRYPGKWLVPSKPGQRGFGDTLHSSREDALAEAGRVASRHEKQKAAEGESEATAKAEAEEKAAFKASGMTSQQAALQARIQAHLGQQVNYKGSPTSRQALIERELAEGHKPAVIDVPDEAARKKAEASAAFMLKQGVPTGNENHPDTIKLRKLQEQAKSAMKKEHIMDKGDGIQRPLSKMEHDYAVSKYKPQVSEQPAEAQGKQLWQMTRAEAQAKLKPMQTGPSMKKYYFDNGSGYDRNSMSLYPSIESAMRDHAYEVREAHQKFSDKVPPEVLADYPELQKPAEPPAVEAEGSGSPTFGDLVKTPDGLVGTMRSDSGIGGSRVGVIDQNGERHWTNRSELKPAGEADLPEGKSLADMPTQMKQYDPRQREVPAPEEPKPNPDTPEARKAAGQIVGTLIKGHSSPLSLVLKAEGLEQVKQAKTSSIGHVAEQLAKAGVLPGMDRAAIRQAILDYRKSEGVTEEEGGGKGQIRIALDSDMPTLDEVEHALQHTVENGSRFGTIHPDTGAAEWAFHENKNQAVNHFINKRRREFAEAQGRSYQKVRGNFKSWLKSHGTDENKLMGIDPKAIKAAKQQAMSSATMTLADYAQHMNDVDDGKVTPEQHADAYRRFKESLPGIEAELSKMKKDDVETWYHEPGISILSNRMAKTKAEAVKSKLDMLARQFDVTGSTNRWTYGQDRQKQLEDAVAAITHDHLKEHAAGVAEQRADRAKRRDERQASYDNPQTFDDWKRKATVLGGWDKLSPEEQEKYDEAYASHRRATNPTKAEKLKEVTGFRAGQEATGEVGIVKGHHQKRNAPTWTVTVQEHLGDNWKDVLSRAKQLGGNYVNARIAKAYGATPGFQFFDEEAANRFKAVLGGESVDNSDKIAAKQAERAEATADKLSDLASRIAERGEESLNRERKDNTYRRARMAQGAEADAREQLAKSKSLTRIAEHIASGKANHLKYVSSGAHVDQLDNLLYRAQINGIRKKQSAKQSVSQDEWERPANRDDIAHAEYPYPYLHRSELQDQAAKLAAVPGLKMFASKLRKMAAEMTGEKDYAQIKGADDLLKIQEALPKMKRHPSADIRRIAARFSEKLDEMNRLQRMDIRSTPELRAALREYVGLKQQPEGADPLKEHLRYLKRQKIDGFFPTPAPLIERMLDHADIGPGMSVLEPSAGIGSIMSAIRDNHPEAELHGIEQDFDIAKALELQGLPHERGDFLQHDKQYDRIVMNPPFENRQDEKHVQHAYNLLKPGGRLVAIMGAGAHNNQRSEKFRDWLSMMGGKVYDTPEGSFAGDDAFRQTGVATKMVIIDKPQGETERHSLSDEARELGGRVRRLVERYSAGGHDERHIAVGKRFGIPPEAVKSALETHPDELAKRDEYMPPSSGRESAVGPTTDHPKHPIGTAKIDLMRHKAGETDNAYVEYLREFNPAELVTSEAEDGVTKSPSFGKYVEWAKAGQQPPPITVFSKPGGKMVSTNRRRVLAAQQAGSKSIVGWHGVDNPETGLPLKYGDLKRAFAEASKPQSLLDSQGQGLLFSRTGQTQRGLFGDDYEAKPLGKQESGLPAPPEPLKQHKPKPNQQSLFSAVADAMGVRVERYAAEQAPSPWFLKSRELLKQKMGQHAPASQVLALLKNNQISPEELEWTGLEKHLRSKGNSPVSQQELHDLIGKFGVEESVLGDNGYSPGLQSLIKDIGWNEDSHGPLHLHLKRMADDAYRDGDHDDANWIDDYAKEAYEKQQATIRPKYGQYSLPGGENYREMLLKLPQERKMQEGWSVRQYPSGRWAAFAPEGYSLDELFDSEHDAQMAAPASSNEGYTSSHWDDPNVLAHIRYKDYVGPDGKKHLHIDEIQSDWHQQGRKEGYSSPELDQKNLARIQELGAKFDRKEATPEETSELEQLQRNRSNRDIQPTVPDAPFKKNWHMLAMKRMLHHAAANGYDRVTWTPGEEHADRYRLDRHLRAIHYHPERKTITAIGLNGETHLDGQVKDGKIHAPSEHREFHGKTLADVFGHEIAHKLETGTPQAATGKVSIAGKDLHIGGIGMRKFYDQMLPADTNKLIKRHGGKVGQFDLHLPEHSDGGGYEAKPPRAIKVHGFDITPSMKAEATSGKGQSMFSVYEEPDLQIERYEQTGANPPGLQPRFRMGAGEQRAAEQFTKIPSTKPPAIFSFLGKAAGLVGKAAGKAAGMAKGAAGQAADKALGAIQPTADKLAGKIGGAAESLDRKGQAAMSKVGMAPKPAPTPAKAPKAQAGAEKPATQGVKAGAPVRLAQAHDIHGNGRQMIPEGTQGTYIGPHSQKGHAEVEIGGIRHVIPTKSLGYSVEHTDHKAIEQHKQTQAEQAQKQKQLTARQRAEAVPEGMEKAERKSLHVSSHDLQPGDVIHHGQPGAHPYGRVLEVHPDGKHVVVEEATPSKGSPDGIATTGRRLTIPGHEKMEGGGSATRMFHTKRLPDEARPIGERKEYKDFFEGAKQLGVHDDVAHEMAMQLWDDSQAMRTPKGFKDGAKVQTEEQMKAPFKANWQQAQEAKDAKNTPAPAQSAPAQPAAKPRHHVSNLQAGDAIRPLKGSESKVNLRYLGPGSSKGFVTVEHPQLGKQEVSVKSVGLLMPKQGGRKVPAMSGRDQMAERAAIMQFDGGLNRKQAARAAVIERGRQNAPDLHQVKRSDFALQRQGILVKDRQGNGFLLYGGKRYPLSPAEFDGNKLVSDPVKIRERIHREQIKALASQDPAAVPAHVKAEYEHHFDRWAGNSPFAKGGGKQPQRQSAKNQPNVGQMSLSPGMAVQPQAPQTPPVLQPPIEARRQAQRVVNADPRGIDTEIDPNRPQAQIDRREAANRAFMDAIAAKFNQNQPAGGLAASPPPTQPVVAASAPPAVSNPAQEQKTPLWQLTRPHKMGRNEVNVQFDSAKQRDLHDYAASVANARSFSGKAGRGKPSGAEQQRAKLKAVADAHFGGNMDAAHQEALQVRAHVKAHMAGAQDGEHRVIPPLGVQPAKPQAPEQPAGDDTMPWDRPFEPKAFKPASPEKAQAHTENVLRGHLKEFARMEAAKTERLRQLWKQFRTAMGVPGDRRFSGARKFKDAVAQGADREGTMQKNWDVVAPQLAQEAPSHFAGDDRDDKIWKFLSGDPPEPLKWHDEELAKKFWKRVHPSYGESLEQMNRGEAPLERLNLNDFLSDSTDDWQESSRWQDDTGPYRASANAFVERFSAAWPNRRGSCEKEGIKRSRKSAGRSG